MKKFLVIILFFIISYADSLQVFAEKKCDICSGTITRSTEYTDLIVAAPAQLRVEGLSILHDVNIEGRLCVAGQNNASDHLVFGEKQLNFSSAGTLTNALSISFDSSVPQLPVYVELYYFASILTIKGKKQTGSKLFSKMSVLLGSNSLLVLLDKLVYIDGIKDGTATITTAFNDNVFKFSFADYSTENGALFYRVCGPNVLGVS